MENQTTSEISHPICCNIQEGEREKKTMGNNIWGERNTALEKANGYATNHKIVEIIPVPHKGVE